MVLEKRHELPSRQVAFDGASVGLVAKLRPLTLVDEDVADRRRKVLDAVEVTMDPVLFAGEDCMKGVAKLVVPLRVHAEAMLLPRPHDPRVSQIAFGDENGRPTERRLEGVDF